MLPRANGQEAHKAHAPDRRQRKIRRCWLGTI